MTAEGGGTRRSQITLSLIVLMSAVGTASVQSILPGMGRSLGIPDAIIGLSFALSAIIFTFSGPYWGQRVSLFGARRLVLIGQFGIALSMLVCGIFLTLAALGMIGGVLAFVGFIVGRGIFGVLGAAAQPAAQAIVVASVSREKRVVALTLLASSFGLGTILGPAVAPFFMLPVVDFGGPPLMFAAIGFGLLIAAMAFLQDHAIVESPGLAQNIEAGATAEPSQAEIDAAAEAKPVIVKMRYTDRRVFPWLLCGLIAFHAQVMASQTMGFLVMDRLRLPPHAAQPMIGMVLMVGAVATLFAQWGIIPRIKVAPRQLLIGGCLMALLGLIGIALARDVVPMTLAYAIASMGFGIFRPGYTAGASLSVREDEQGAVAGLITANNAGVYIFGPMIGILLYGVWRPLPYLLGAAAISVMIAFALRFRSQA